MGMPTPENITVFNQTDRSKQRYYDIKRLSGRTLTVVYSLEENGKITTNNRLLVKIPQGLDESGVKDYIISEITNKL